MKFFSFRRRRCDDTKDAGSAAIAGKEELASASTRSIACDATCDDSETATAVLENHRTVVCFNEGHNEVHDCPWTILGDHDKVIVGDNFDNDDDESSLRLGPNEILQSRCWYAMSEISHFKQDVRIMAKYTLSCEQEEWAQSLWHVHQDLTAAKSMQDIKSIMDQAAPVDAMLVGMEKWALPELHAARLRQRNLQISAIREWSSSSRHDGREEREERIRKASRAASRTSRFLAIYLARTATMSAATATRTTTLEA